MRRNRDRGGDAPPLGILAMAALVGMLDAIPAPDAKPAPERDAPGDATQAAGPQRAALERIAKAALESADGDSALAFILEVCASELGAEGMERIKNESRDTEDPVVNRAEFVHLLHLDMHDFMSLGEPQDQKRFAVWVAEFAEFLTDGPPVAAG